MQDLSIYKLQLKIDPKNQQCHFLECILLLFQIFRANRSKIPLLISQRRSKCHWISLPTAQEYCRHCQFSLFFPWYPDQAWFSPETRDKSWRKPLQYPSGTFLSRQFVGRPISVRPRTNLAQDWQKFDRRLRKKRLFARLLLKWECKQHGGCQHLSNFKNFVHNTVHFL